MVIKIFMCIALLTGLKFWYGSFGKSGPTSETPIDEAWWNGLSEEWKTILVINQNFQKQDVDIFKIQQEYINRMKLEDEKYYSEMNTSLYELNHEKRFDFSCTDLYARALRTNHVKKNDSIDLSTLADLNMLYMANGPADLTPLKKFPHLNVLILNYCGIDNTIELSKQILDLTPLKYLKELKVLHCSSPALKSLEAIRDLVNLEELKCENSGVTSLAPLKKLKKLKRLSVGSNVISAPEISRLVNVEELYIDGLKKVPTLSRLKKLKKLSIAEGEFSLIKGSYRISSIDFLEDLKALEFLDMYHTSYKGSLDVLNRLKNLKAVTLPPVSSSEMQAFKKANKRCIIINSYQFER